MTKTKVKNTTKPKAKTNTTCKCKTKNNKKGFTLVELLAVIIILAIVVGITIPAIMSTVSSAKKSAFQTASQSCADWIERQYQIYVINSNDTTLNANLKTKFVNAKTTAQTLTNDIIEGCGLKIENVTTASKFKVSAQGRVCLLLTANPSGDYVGVGTASQTGSTGTDTNYSKGGACSGISF